MVVVARTEADKKRGDEERYRCLFPVAKPSRTTLWKSQRPQWRAILADEPLGLICWMSASRIFRNSGFRLFLTSRWGFSRHRLTDRTKNNKRTMFTYCSGGPHGARCRGRSIGLGVDYIVLGHGCCVGSGSRGGLSDPADGKTDRIFLCAMGDVPASAIDSAARDPALSIVWNH